MLMLKIDYVMLVIRIKYFETSNKYNLRKATVLNISYHILTENF